MCCLYRPFFQRKDAIKARVRYISYITALFSRFSQGKMRSKHVEFPRKDAEYFLLKSCGKRVGKGWESEREYARGKSGKFYIGFQEEK